MLCVPVVCDDHELGGPNGHNLAFRCFNSCYPLGEGSSVPVGGEHQSRFLMGAIMVMEQMGVLQPVLLSPNMLPANWPLFIIDFKNCFFLIPLYPDDR